jgi:uncharacterized protein
MNTPPLSNSFFSVLWDIFCAVSLIGIWPRFIEPSLILTTKLKLKIPDLPDALQGLKLLQFSDLHLNANLSNHFLDKLIHKIQALKPDLILFTGDSLCYGQMVEPDRLRKFFQSLTAPYGCFAVLGNHDYAECVSVNSSGDYDVIEPGPSLLKKAFSRLQESVVLSKKVTKRVKKIPFNESLMRLFEKTSFKLLHNETVTITIKNTKFNVCGLGEYMMGRSIPSKAFSTYDDRYPGVILLHNPDGAPELKKYPGNIILSGHTHGGQVNLPWMWKKFTLLENMEFKKGLQQLGDKWIYINRGIGSVIPFRLFSPPEILFINLSK